MIATNINAMAETELDNPVLKLEDSWTYQVTVLADLIARRVTRAVQAVSELNLSQWRVLAAIADTPGRTASQVVDVTPMDKGIVSRGVSVLVQEGYLRREASPADGRTTYLFLTESGQAIYKSIVAELDRCGVSGREGSREVLRLLQSLNAELG